ncbi:MAG: IS3 family transposase [Halofilum sp. (in: g-proteobacteria)]|nr:IS3 family transposase [Halofilum sp. (in: g-proteobacteria)]
MSGAVSTSTGRRYGVARVAREWGVARSTVYDRRRQAAATAPPAKRGPKTAYSDAALAGSIRETIEDAPFTGEGHRKVWARLRWQHGIRAGRPRVLRLMREQSLLAPQRAGRPHGPQVHDGTIVTEAPDRMWGTDATAAWTPAEGAVTVFALIDHHTLECLGLHAAKPATRFEALEPIRQGVRAVYGGFRADIAVGLALRHDHGPQYVSDDFQHELDVPRHRIEPELRARAAGQRHRRMVHGPAQGAAAVDP